jgi:hypothetical protein
MEIMVPFGMKRMSSHHVMLLVGMYLHGAIHPRSEVLGVSVSERSCACFLRRCGDASMR